MALQQLVHFGTTVYGFFCKSTLKSLFIIFVGLKTKMWNVMDTWIILENNNFLLLLPQQNAPFLQRNIYSVILQRLTMDELSNMDGLVTKRCDDMKKCRQKLTLTSKYKL